MALVKWMLDAVARMGFPGRDGTAPPLAARLPSAGAVIQDPGRSRADVVSITTSAFGEPSGRAGQYPLRSLSVISAFPLAPRLPLAAVACSRAAVALGVARLLPLHPGPHSGPGQPHRAAGPRAGQAVIRCAGCL
jgi:hypothetical protein